MAIHTHTPVPPPLRILLRSPSSCGFLNPPLDKCISDSLEVLVVSLNRYIFGAPRRAKCVYPPQSVPLATTTAQRDRPTLYATPSAPARSLPAILAARLQPDTIPAPPEHNYQSPPSPTHDYACGHPSPVTPMLTPPSRTTTATARPTTPFVPTASALNRPASSWMGRQVR